MKKIIEKILFLKITFYRFYPMNILWILNNIRASLESPEISDIFILLPVLEKNMI